MAPHVLTVPEMAARLGISRFTLYLRVKRRSVPAFRALYRTGPLRFLSAGQAVRPLPHFGPREQVDIPWVGPAEVARTLRVSKRLVQSACARGFFQVWRSPGARRRPRFAIAIDAVTKLPLPAGTLVAPRSR